MTTIMDLIERGVSGRLGAALLDSADDLRAALTRYEALEDAQEKLSAEKQIKGGEPIAREWPERWGEKPTERTLLYADLDEAQADLNEAYAEILDTIVSILRTEG